MKVILDIKDSKADALMDVLDDLPYVKAKLLKKKEKGAATFVRTSRGCRRNERYLRW